MKKYLLISTFIILTLILVGCNNEKEVTPEERFTEYVSLWNERDFDNMYDFLSSESKEKVSKEDFVGRYTKIYEDLKVDPLAVTFNPPEEEVEREEEVEQVELPFRVEMDTVGGAIAFNHQASWVKEQIDEEMTEWLLQWDTSFIFPQLEEGDTISLQTVSPTRGSILDRNGLALAENGVARQIGLVPKNMEGQEDEVIAQVAELLEITPEEIEKALNQSWVKPDYFVPIKTIRHDDYELREKLGQVPGVQGKDVEARVYPLGKKAAHLTGNIAPITAEDLEKYPDKGYSSHDMIGRRGLELVLEDRLRGEPGVQIIINKTNDEKVVLAEKEVQHGEDVQLTIDLGLQGLIFDQLNGKTGTAVAINPITGETLALVSTPAYDPNVLTLGATSQQWAELQNDPANPMLNRFNAIFTPGSVIKPITASIGLKNGTITWDKALTINGFGWKKDDSWGNYEVRRVSDPGVPIDLEKALIYSDNIYFAQNALEMGQEAFEAGLAEFGFGEDMPFLYPMHTSHFGEIQSDIALADSSYGQGQVQMNILHLATSYTPFINGGDMIKPILEVTEEKGQVWKAGLLSEEDANKINEALRKVVSDSSGTGRGARIDGYPLAGKTGTAEYGKTAQGEKGKENGWFVAYNPDNPELLIALMLEEESSGNTVNKMKDIFVEYLQ